MYINKNEQNIYNMLMNHIFSYPSPANLSYIWNFGFMSAIFLSIQMLSGMFLAMHYCSDVSLAFSSIEHMTSDVNYGWFLSYLHANGASFFFMTVYMHIASGLYYMRFDYLNFLIWVSGILIFFLMMGTAFIGYVLPWGQMSFWGATVITNLVSAMPVMGSYIVYWLWGGFSVSGPTLARFFSLHYLLPFIMLSMSILHMYFLHSRGSSNPSFISPSMNSSYLPLYPYFLMKDWVGLSCFLVIFLYFICFYPNLLGHSDNYIEANPMSTPEHMVPEWYFLPFYAMLSSIPNKLIGVIAMVLSILIFFFLPIISFMLYKLNYYWTNSAALYSYMYPFMVVCFFNMFILLGWMGANPVEEPFMSLGFFLLLLYFVIIMFNTLLMNILFFNFKG